MKHNIFACFLVLLFAIHFPLSAKQLGSVIHEKLPNITKQCSTDKVQAISFGPEVLGVLIPQSVIPACACLIVWNGTTWEEDKYFEVFGEAMLENHGFYRPYNHSTQAYAVNFDETEWSRAKLSNQFSKTFDLVDTGYLSVIQLDSPHAPFVYIEMVEGTKHSVFRIATPHDYWPDHEAWAKEAEFITEGGKKILKLTYEIYRTGTGQEPALYSVDYQFRDAHWYYQAPN
ncbi:MAG TPA: hypothetical protein VFV28_07450 [Limnobacter sp.]|nr:hypothetical protein [Limnobacter sp.]